MLAVKYASVLLFAIVLQAQQRQEPGKPIGKVSTKGDLIVMELDEGALGAQNLFDLDRHTLRFTPEGSGYRAENLPLAWDAEFGAEMSGAEVHLKNFAFPFSGKSWDSFSVGASGSIAFGAATGGGRGGRGGGVSIGRFDQLQEAARGLLHAPPSICVFLKPRLSGRRYVKELEDRVVVTWDVTEPFGGIQDFTWTPTVNRFQAVLRRDGAIDMSYDRLAARDAIVGIYPAPSGKEQVLASAEGKEELHKVTISAVDGLFVRVALETHSTGAPYRVRIGGLEWTIRGVSGRGGATRYLASGRGLIGGVKAEGGTLTLEGVLPATFRNTDPIDVVASAGTEEVVLHGVKFAGVRSPEADLSAVKRQDGPFAAIYESFHYYALPNPRDLTCTVLRALGDKFDLLAYYSDFRVDNQEAGTPSTGPLGGGVTGIGQVQRGLESYCSEGRFQWQFVQPVFAGSNQMQERPPAGTSSDNPRDIAYYDRQLGERMPDGRMPPYDLAMSQIGHEMGHRWSAFVSAKVGGETIPLGPTHWARGLQAPVAFPYQRPTEASAMGGSVWQDNFDGTFTQLDDDYYVPATGWSYLDLYLMGLITASEVPDFFILRNLTPAGRDASGRPLVKADRVKVTIQDVIAAEGPRLPGVDRSQKKFNTGMVVVVTRGASPSKELIERTNGIRERWIDYWETTTGHRASMTASPR
jgi:hypothetical protein